MVQVAALTRFNIISAVQVDFSQFQLQSLPKAFLLHFGLLPFGPDSCTWNLDQKIQARTQEENGKFSFLEHSGSFILLPDILNLTIETLESRGAVGDSRLALAASCSSNNNQQLDSIQLQQQPASDFINPFAPFFRQFCAKR